MDAVAHLCQIKGAKKRSGWFVQWALQRAGVLLPRTALADQYSLISTKAGSGQGLVRVRQSRVQNSQNLGGLETFCVLG
jgi:hypothetical protein